ncbi:putative two-component system sensor histidine kinase [Selenomonas ruminantium subsp. lactilytica TAM6421]|uniref:histidine kinase n=1 Tax=Selenomonas ruminantium subsp. lactilytica (strain NBRC 103574 / TAM6421) TaxID=927704 RepID=I0GT43_SELRL|nr:amino acid permease [Selenomonas ruminantium]BAL83930.1 putative two-component system sensor histidine kinase [Selenomonas ruminantium subsp. lactilytica TAM6421]
MDKQTQKNLLSPLHVWALSLGCAVGWGAFMVPANLFIPTAGPLGTMLAMGISTALLLVIGANFCRLAEKYHDDGGIVAYVRNIIGHDHAFLAAWILLIAYLSILWANATATVLLFRFLHGDLLSWGYLYTIAGFDIYFGEMLAVWLVIIVFGLFTCYSGTLARYLNTFCAILFFLSVIILSAAMFSQVDTSVFKPAFQTYTNPIMQIFSMVMLAPWMFFGFEAVTHACDDFDFSSKRLFPIVIAAVLSGGLIYILLAAMAIMSIPPEYASWTTYIAQRPHLEGLAGLPVFHSVHAVFGREGLLFLCVSIDCAIITSLMGLYRTCGRLLYFMARCEVLPAWFSKRAADETPRNAIIFVMLISLLIPLLGRISIVWLCDVITVVGSVAYGYASYCAYLLAKREGSRQDKFRGIFGVFISCLFFFCPLLPGLLLGGSLDTESYLMLSVWSILGFIYYWYVFKHDTHNRFGHSTSMCIMILFLNFFSTSIWLRQVTEERLKDAATGSFTGGYSIIVADSVVQMAMIMIILLLMTNIFITLKRREHDMTRTLQQQHEVNHAQNTYLRNLAHDIRIPMEAAQLSVHHSLENCTICSACAVESCPHRIPDRLANCLGQLDSHSQYLMSLISSMLDKRNMKMGGIEMGKIPLDFARMDWRYTLQHIKDIFALKMQEKNIFFEVYPIELPHPHVICDTQRLERLLINLVSNACEFTPNAGGVMVTLMETGPAAVKYQGQDVPGAIYEIHINDTGTNMPPAIIQHMAEPFELETSGLGGLYIVQGLTTLLGGSIKINTNTGQGPGKDIVVTLPLPLAEPLFEPAAEF